MKPVHRSLVGPAGQSGFTIIELLIASTISSAILLVITTGIIQFSKQYYKGLITSSTQNTARMLIDDVTRALQYNGGGVTPLSGSPPQSGGYCIGGFKRYSYQLNRQVVDVSPDPSSHQGYHGLVSDSVTNCNISTAPLDLASAPANLASVSPVLSNPRELLGKHMRLAKFDIIPAGEVYTVTIRVVYGDDDVLCSPSVSNDCNISTPSAGVASNARDLSCRGNIGTAYCAVSELTTTVMKRVN